MEDDTCDHDLCRRVGRCTGRSATGSFTSTDGLEDTGDAVGAKEDTEVVYRSEDGELLTEVDDGTTKEDVIVSGKEDGCHDQTERDDISMSFDTVDR